MNRKDRPNAAFVDWFRRASPYIHAHRGKVMVLSFGGEMVNEAGFAEPRPRHRPAQRARHPAGTGPRGAAADRAAPGTERGAAIRIVNGLRVTDGAALACVKEANGVVRVEIEALLSTGLANSPMAGVRIRVGSGNFVTAKPLGVIDGVDYQHTGEVRRVDADALRQLLDSGAIALVPGLGYSPTGEVFNLSAPDVAGAVASGHRRRQAGLPGRPSASADSRGRTDQQHGPARCRPAAGAAAQRIGEEQQRVLQNAAEACRAGVNRVHILERHRDGILLAELFTRDGAGTLVTAEPYELVRTARIDDVGGILELIAPMEEAGILVKRSRERLEQEIDHFIVIERDGAVIACAALYPFPDVGMAEVACVAVHPDYREAGRGDTLLDHIEGKARDLRPRCPVRAVDAHQSLVPRTRFRPRPGRPAAAKAARPLQLAPRLQGLRQAAGLTRTRTGRSSTLSTPIECGPWKPAADRSDSTGPGRQSAACTKTAKGYTCRTGHARRTCRRRTRPCRKGGRPSPQSAGDRACYAAGCCSRPSAWPRHCCC
jgi:amino-acid N-acetyltransferase